MINIKNKRKIIIFFVAILYIFILVNSFGFTYAYLVDFDEKNNSFIVGENEVTIIEEFEPPKKLEPDSSFKKKPTVKNVGNLPCYVRMRVDFSDSKMKELCEDLDINTTDWEYNAADEYYYYKHLLLPEEVTTALFTEVTLKALKSDGVTPVTDADIKDFDILIYAESKQHLDHTGVHPKNEYKEIWE